MKSITCTEGTVFKPYSILQQKKILNRPGIQKSDPYHNPSLYLFAHNIGCPAFIFKWDQIFSFSWVTKKNPILHQATLLNLTTKYHLLLGDSKHQSYTS